MVILKNKDTAAFPWAAHSHTYMRGQVEYQGALYTAQAADQLLTVMEGLKTREEFFAFVQELRGNFALIVERPMEDEIWCAVDIASSLPLFFHQNGRIVSDDPDLIRQETGIAIDDIDLENYAELLLTTYSMSNRTVYREIGQVDLGQCVYLKENHIETQFYYTHICEIVNETYEEAYKRYEEANHRMAKRMLRMLNNRQAVIALSGGYDSRYILALLKAVDYKNVVCFTIGRRDAFEVQFAQEICQKVGYPWYCFENTDEVNRQLSNGALDQYLLQAHHHSALPHISFYNAAEQMVQQGIIESDAVFITGFCGDLPAGSFVFDEQDRPNIQYSVDFLAKMFYYNEYFNYDCHPKVDELYIEKIKAYICQKFDFVPNDLQKFIQMHDALFTCSRPAKMVVNANRGFELLGHEWLLPLWDYDFLNYWYSVSYHYREGQKLYRDFLDRELFKRWDITMLQNTTHSQPWYFRRTRLKTKLKHGLGSVLYRLSFYTNIPIRRRSDVDNQCTITMGFFRRIRQKNFVNFKRPVINPILHIWLCEQVYGEESLKRVKRFMKGSKNS